MINLQTNTLKLISTCAIPGIFQHYTLHVIQHNCTVADDNFIAADKVQSILVFTSIPVLKLPV